MAEYEGTKIDYIEINDTVMRNKINQNFANLRAFQTIADATYTFDATPPTNAGGFDYLLFADASSNSITLTLPAESAGRHLVVVRKDAHGSNTVTVDAASGDKLNGASPGSPVSIPNVKGARAEFTCEGTASGEGWWGHASDT